MSQVEIYDSIEKKKFTAPIRNPLSPVQAFIHTLELMEFYAALRKDKTKNIDSGAIDWIELKVKSSKDGS